MKPEPNETEQEFVRRYITSDLGKNVYPDLEERTRHAIGLYAVTQGAEIPQDLEVAIKEGIEITPEISDVFVIGEDGVESSKSLKVSLVPFPTGEREKYHGANILEVAKSVVDVTTQDQTEVNRGYQLDGANLIEPPYPPELMSAFLEVDETHFRCCRAKSTDAVGRHFRIEPAVRRKSQVDSKIGADVDNEISAIEDFIEDCNDIIGFDGVLERASMDYEAIGWAAIEVIRSLDKKVRYIQHIPATRIRPLKGWAGFAEVRPDGQLTYYQVFGQKVLSPTEKDIFNPSRNAIYNPRYDGSIEDAEWNFIDRQTGQPTNAASKAANEVIWIPKHHPSTIYYGYTDILSALGSVLINVSIRDFSMQFFSHNTVPRMAVIIEGAKLAPDVKSMITNYFSEEIRGKAHKTLVIPVPAAGRDVRVRFERLGTDVKEGWFQDTRKNNAQNIMTAHGVSPAIIGINEAASLGSGKGLSQAELYKDRIVTPSQSRWARVLNRLFRFGLGVTKAKLRFTPLDIRDIESEMNTLKGYNEKGAISINEMRERAGLGDPIPGGDKFTILTGQGLMDVSSDEMTTTLEKTLPTDTFAIDYQDEEVDVEV